MSEPGWKRNRRNGPLDWWLACQDHGYDYRRGCMTCEIVEDHNADFGEKLARETAGCETRMRNDAEKTEKSR